MIKAMLDEGKCKVEIEGNILSVIADLLATPPVVISAVCKRLELPKDIKKDIVREVINDLEEKFLKEN